MNRSAVAESFTDHAAGRRENSSNGRRYRVDLEYLLVSLFVLEDDWWQETYLPAPRKAGRPPSLSAGEVLTLAVLAQRPRGRSEWDFWRFADAHLRGYFPNRLSHGQLNRPTHTGF